MTTGAIVAGGKSTRFGAADKTLTPVAGTPMIRRVADRLAGRGPPVEPGSVAVSDGVAVVDELVINCRAAQREAIAEAMADYPLAVTYAIDERPDRGPVAGIRNVCQAASSDRVAVVACDMPLVDPRVLTFLEIRLRSHDAAVPRLESGWLQPMQAVYRTEPTVLACDDALTRGATRAVDPLENLECAVVEPASIRSVSTDRTFTNVNTPADLERVTATYRRAVE